MTSAFGKNATRHTTADQRVRPLNSKAAEGDHVRWLQMVARRLKRRPDPDRIVARKSALLEEPMAETTFVDEIGLDGSDTLLIRVAAVR